MLELYLPYLIALALGMDVQAAEPGENSGTLPAETVRAPEPQVVDGSYTSAIEVKPILDMTQVQWVAIGTESGNDLLYFSTLLAWRCGLWEIRYGINGDATTVLPMEPCHMDSLAPGAMVDLINFPIYLTFPKDSIQTLRIELTFDDGTEDFVDLARAQILLP